jgi:hypothetical protein
MAAQLQKQNSYQERRQLCKTYIEAWPLITVVPNSL